MRSTWPFVQGELTLVKRCSMWFASQTLSKVFPECVFLVFQSGKLNTVIREYCMNLVRNHFNQIDRFVICSLENCPLKRYKFHLCSILSNTMIDTFL